MQQMIVLQIIAPVTGWQQNTTTNYSHALGTGCMVVISKDPMPAVGAHVATYDALHCKQACHWQVLRKVHLSPVLGCQPPEEGVLPKFLG